jgi:hypothetical protein
MKIIKAAAAVGLALLSGIGTGTATAQVTDYGLRVPTVPGCPAGTSWTKVGPRFVCQAPPPPPPPPPVVTAPPPQPVPVGGQPAAPANLLAVCGAAIRSAQAGQAWSGNFLPVQFIPNMGYGWTAYSTATAGSGNYVTTDGTMTLYGDAWGSGVDGVFSGIDNLSAQELYMGECRISHASGSVLSVDFVPIAPNCSGCNSGR